MGGSSFFLLARRTIGADAALAGGSRKDEKKNDRGTKKVDADVRMASVVGFDFWRIVDRMRDRRRLGVRVEGVTYLASSLLSLLLCDEPSFNENRDAVFKYDGLLHPGDGFGWWCTCFVDVDVVMTFVTLLDHGGANDSTSPGEERITATTTSAADDIITLFIVCRNIYTQSFIVQGKIFLFCLHVEL